MPNTISNSDDVIDSRDIIARIEELEGERDDTPCTCEAGALDEDDCTCSDEDRAAQWAAENPDDAAELATLTALAIGDLPKGIPHYIVIDEEATARNIRMDYTAVEFGDVTYWVR